MNEYYAVQAGFVLKYITLVDTKPYYKINIIIGYVDLLVFASLRVRPSGRRRMAGNEKQYII